MTKRLSAEVVQCLRQAVTSLALAESLGAPRGSADRIRRLIEHRKRKPRPSVVEEPLESAWDPEPLYEAYEPSRCKALLLEIMRRAIHDWVLYRGHTKLNLRKKAEGAYIWLFEEEPGHYWWTLRKKEGYMITAFLVICETCDLDPEYVRRKARQTTVKQIMTSGRPAERRRVRKEVASVEYAEYPVDETAISIESLDVMDQPRGSFSEASYTPSYY